MLNKKGDLAISTNAIVILIIAVIMLGLIIAFVTQGFGAVSDKFFGEIEKLPNPPPAGGANPITTSEVTIGHPGEPIGLKISVFNPTDAASPTTTRPAITCNNNILDTTSAGAVQVNARAIPPRESVTYTYVQKVSAAAQPGKHLCQITVTSLGAAGAADLIIEVRE